MDSCPFTIWEFDGNAPIDLALSQPQGIFSILSENFTQVGILAMPTDANLKAAIYWPKGVLTYESPLGDEFVKIHFRLTEMVSLTRQPGGALSFHPIAANAECLLLFGDVESVECGALDGEHSKFRPHPGSYEPGFLRPPSREVIKKN